MKLKLREKKVNVFGKSIPLIAIVAVVFIIVGIASAALVETLITATVTTREPITTAITDNLEAPPEPEGWDPGDEDVVELTITNKANLAGGYGLIITPTVTYTIDGVPAAGATITDGGDGGQISDGGDADVLTYNIEAGGDDTDATAAIGTITYTVGLELGADTPKEGEVAELYVDFDIERVAPF